VRLNEEAVVTIDT